jgi:fructose-1,6-bisphosphatase-3
VRELDRRRGPAIRARDHLSFYEYARGDKAPDEARAIGPAGPRWSRPDPRVAMTDTQLRTLAKRYPTIDAVLAELANLAAILALPKPRVHVISDVHGEHAKLQQVINNASGSMRPLVERLFGDRMSAPEIEQLLDTIYFPRRADPQLVMPQLALVIRELAKRYTLKYVEQIIPDPFDALFRELVFSRELGRDPAFVARQLEPFIRHGRADELVELAATVVKHLAIGELVVAGDLGDRGPRIDKVIAQIMAQPRVSITWGNHDASWMAASLGHPAAIATVVRLSLRYQRLAQLEEGYGISLGPVAQLSRVYDDPASCFGVKGPGSVELARMQKAIAILQFKLEGQLFLRRPEWQLEHRALLHRIDPEAGTIEIDGKRHPLLDRAFPTIDWSRPYELAREETACLAELVRAFTESQPLARQMAFVAERGGMWLRRDLCAIFHGCVPVDEAGEPLPFVVDGEPRRGRALFEAIEVVVQRAFRARAPDDVDLLFYLWTGPRSPCFGKDRMATLESYLIADPAAQEEIKNPYFKLIHDPAFCGRVLQQFGVDPEHGFIVNGHVPVRLDQGETPIKRSGRAITIDGAFAAAYGDKGFSLVLGADRMYLAQHHHFEGEGHDIVPTVSEIERYPIPRTVGDTEVGAELRAEIAALEALVLAYERNALWR